jgi:LPXTG-site transpeptidase (sortase) family protein
MPVNRWAPVVSVLALCLGLVLLFSSWPAQPASSPRATLAALTTSPAPSSLLSPTITPSPTPAPTIPPGYRINIVRLSIDLPIAEGDLDRDTVRQETPENFAFHLPGTAVPGDGSNSYIYAHARRGMFLSLWNVREGDEVTIITPDAHELRYVVSEVHPRVDPSDVTWAARTSSERLTLQTSTGPNPGDPRFVVIALPV